VYHNALTKLPQKDVHLLCNGMGFIEYLERDKLMTV